MPPIAADLRSRMQDVVEDLGGFKMTCPTIRAHGRPELLAMRASGHQVGALRIGCRKVIVVNPEGEVRATVLNASALMTVGR